MSNIRINGNTKSNIKISLDRTGVLNLQNRAKESSALLNDYISRRSNNEWMSEDEIENYRSALDRYKNSTGALADIQRNFGNYNEEDGKERDEWLSTLSTDFDSAAEVYGRYKTADSYNAYLQSLEADKELDNLDLDALSGEITELEDRIKRMDERPQQTATMLSAHSVSAPYSQLIAPKTLDPYSSLTTPSETLKPTITPDSDVVSKKELETLLSEKKATYNRAKERQDTNRVLAMLEGVTDRSSENYDPEYETYVQKGASIENPSYDETRTPISVFGWTPFGDGEEVNNPVTFSLDNARMFANGAATSAGANSLGMDAVVLEMSDEQINNYNYLISKHGRETADIYLEAVRDQIRGEKADEFFEKHLEDKWLAEIMYSTVQGVDQWMSGTGALTGSDFADKRLLDPQLVGVRAREDLADDSIPVWYNFKEGKWEDQILGSSVGQVAYDFGSTTANMAPSIAIGALSNALIPGSGAYVTTGLMGASAGGNAYKEALNRGYDEGQAQTYGILVGSSEALLQYAIGGISKAGGKLSNNIIKKAISGIDKGFARFALEMGGKMTAEGLEEGLQEILAPFFENLAFQTDNDLSEVNWEQAAYSYLLGSLSALGFEGGSAVVNKGLSTIANHKEGKRVIDNGATDSLVALANEMSGVVDADTAANLSKLASKVYNKKNINTKAVGKLSYAVNDARIQQNKADIVKALEGKGVSENKAAKYADILFEMNEEFFAGKESTFTLGTDEQWKKITGDENAYSVLRNIITDEKSPVNIRNLRYGLSRNGIRVDGDGNVNQEDVENYYTRQMVRAADEGLITPVKNEFDVSDDGKTYAKTDNGTIEVIGKEFVDGEDGKLKFKVNGDQIVNTGDVSFADEGEAIVYSTIVNIGMDAEAANAVISLYKGKDKKAGSRFAYGINLAFNAGKINRSLKILQTIHSLTAQQADAVYKLGRQYAQKSAQKAQERVDAKKKKTTSTNRGEVIYEGDLADENGNLAVKESELNGMQQASLSGIRLLAEISNIRFHIYRSEKMISKDGGEEFRYIAPNGESVTANGFYITGTNDIYIDLNAGNNGEGTMMYTAAHEIMHFIKDFSPAKFQQIADFLMEEYAKRNVNVKKLLDKQIEIVKRSVENRSDSEKPSEQEIHDMAFEEMVCDAMSGMLIDGSFADSMAKLRQTNKGLWQTIADAVAKLLEKWGVVVNAYKNKQMDSQEARLVAQMDGAFRKLQQMFAEGMVDAGAAYAQMEKTGTSANFKNKVRYSLREDFPERSNSGRTKNITIDMTEDARYEVLKDKKIRPQRVEIDESFNIDFEFLENNIKSLVEKPLIKKLRELGYLKEYNTSVIDVGFELTAGGVKKSLHSQTMDYGGSFADFAKVVLNLQKLLDHSVLLDVHSDKAKGTVKENPRLKQVYVLISAFEEGNSITPVQFEIKRYVDEQNRLYLAVALTKIETGVMGDTILDKDQASTHLLPVSKTEAGVVGNTASPKRMRTYLLPASSISISDLFANVNPMDGKFLKYVPNQFLNDEQIQAKNKALELDGIKYSKASKKGQIKTAQSTAGGVKYQGRSTALLEREETRTDYAPTFYSKMEQVVDGIKAEKIGANDVVSYLKGKGVKDEEIKWSGIQVWLEGKKSVTKKELQQFVADNTLVIDEEILTDDPNIDEEKQARHSDSALVGGTNYREMLFHLPNVSYTNDNMSGHWGDGAEGVLMHTRFQDFTGADGRKLLFVEEIQSDWHNEARKTGYAKPPSPRLAEYLAKMEAIDERYDALVEEDKKTKENDPRKQQINDEIFALEDEMEALGDEYEEINSESRLREAAPPSDLFRKTYHEYILKRLIRMAAEEGYDSIAWTPAKVQMARWDEDFKEAFRILYDQNIPSFLKKYGKQWGATVNKTSINAKIEVEYDEDIIEESLYDELTSGTMDVWRMDLTDSMRESALYAGQMMFQERSRESAEESSENKYSYEELIRKPDMLITTVGGNIPTNRADVVALAKKNAAKVGKTNKDGSVSVYVEDVGADVVLPTGGLRHGLDRRFAVNAPVTVKAGEILQRSIRINEMTPTKKVASGSYVLIGAATNKIGELYVVRSVVNRYTSELTEMDVLYAINAKTEPTGIKKGNQAGAYPQGSRLNGRFLTGSTISIADLLDYVNEYFPDILPEDVLRHYGYTERPSGDLGGAVLYQQRTSDPTQEKVVQQLEKENAQLVADLAAVKELLALQGKVTDGKMFSKTSLQAAAKRLAGKVNAKGDVAELAELLNDAYGYILTERETSWDGFAEKARPVTAWLMRHAQEKKTRTDEAQAALKYIRSKSVYLDEAQKQEVDYIFGSYNDFRKKAMGRITVTDGARVSLDSQWQEFAEMFPAYFDRDVNSADQPVALMEAIDALQNTYDYFGSDMMNKQSLLMDVYDGYWDIATLRTVADKAQKEINLLKAKHRRQMAAIRDKHKQADAQLRRECQDGGEERGIRGDVESNQAKDAREINLSQRTNGKVMYQERSTALLEKEDTRTDYAPVFYSKLERVVDDMKEQKLGADSVIGYLKGRGIKDEEIKQLGIRELLKGKKSVTKLDLKKVIAENKPRIEEVVLNSDSNATEYVSNEILPGGSNYRDILFRVSDSAYSNKTMRGHWQEHAKGILAHTRIQDFIDVYGKRLLFIEEVQSDWYNQKNRMGSEEIPSDKVEEYKTKKENLEKQRQEDPEKIDQEIMYLQNEYYNILDEENQLEAFPPDNLFGEAYYEYILKRLIRMAAEQGYDSIAWTPASVQMLRWTEDFKEAFHILYDQNMVGFLKRHGKQWGAKVGTTLIKTNVEICDVDKLEEYEDTVGDENYNVRVEDIPLTPVEVWNMELTEPMKHAVLYEGQMMFQERDKSSDSSPVYDEQAYRDIIRKSDMPITDIGGFVPKNRADTVVYAKRKAAKFGKINKDGWVSVYVDDLDEDVLLGTDGLKYGLHSTKDTRKDANYIVTLNTGEILRNAVRIDEMFVDDAMDDQYVLLGVAANDKDQLHIVRFIVNRPENELASIEVLATEDRAVLELFGSSDSRSTIPVSALLEYLHQSLPLVFGNDMLFYKRAEYNARLEYIKKGGTRLSWDKLKERVLFIEKNSEKISLAVSSNDDIIKLNNRDVRDWYVKAVLSIKDNISETDSLELKARKAFLARSRLRIIAREMMADDESRKALYDKYPNKSFEELVTSKMRRKAMTREEAILDMYETATKTNADRNKEFGVGGE